MNNIWCVFHTFEDDDHCEHSKVIGFFRTRDQARMTVESLRTMPGFKKYPHGFFIGKDMINNGAWEEGFLTMLGDQSMAEPEPPLAVQTVLDSEVEASPDGLWHVLHSYRDQWNCVETKEIGLFDDLERAKRAVGDRLDQPGFRRRPDGFQITPVTLGKIAYQNGFDGS